MIGTKEKVPFTEKSLFLEDPFKISKFFLKFLCVLIQLQSFCNCLSIISDEGDEGEFSLCF